MPTGWLWSVLKPPLRRQLWSSILGSGFFVAYSHLCKVSSYCGGRCTLFGLPLAGGTPYRGGCYTPPLLRDRPPHSYPPKGGMSKWHLPPPKRGYHPKGGGAKKAYTFFQFYSDRGQRPFCLKIFLYTFFEIYFPINFQPTCLKIIFLRCVRARIFWHDMRHTTLEDCLAYHHHHLALK